MELGKDNEEQILTAIRKAANCLEYGEVRIKINKDAPMLEITIDTHEILRFRKHGNQY